MNDMVEPDLTERMLIRQLTGKETSCISNSKKEINQPTDCDVLVNSGAYSSKWFRLRHKAFWLMEGIPISTIEECLASIVMSKNERTHNNLIDTVKKYGEGNWCYEFSKRGMFFQKKAKEALDVNSSVQALRSAMSCYSVASYPHLKGDRNADRAQLQVIQVLRQYLEVNHIKYKELQIPSKSSSDQNIKAWLLLPKSDEPVPMVLCANSYECIFSDYAQLFKSIFEKHNCALLLLDNPHSGQNQSFVLDYDCSKLHREVLDYIVENESAIDSTRIGTLGFRFGGNIVTRLSYMRSSYIKASICVGPAINKCFVDVNILNNLPEVTKSNLANRLDRDVADWDSLQPIFSQFSLKVQGLLGSKINVPIATVGFQNDPICDKDDLALLASSSEKGKVFVYKKEKLNFSLDHFYNTVDEWFGKYLW